MIIRDDSTGTSQSSFQIGNVTLVSTASGPVNVTLPTSPTNLGDIATGSSSIIQVETIADLQAIANSTPDPTRLYYLKGYYAPWDGGGGRMFYWNASLATTVDADDDGTPERSDDYGLTTLAPTNLATLSTPGRFVGIITGTFLNVLWAGIRSVSDIFSVGDQTPRINLVFKQAVRINNLAYNAPNTGENDALLDVFFPGGNYRIESTLRLTTQSPRGANQLRIYGVAATYFVWMGSDPNIPMWRLTKYSWSLIENIQIIIRKPVDRVVLCVNDGSGNGPTSTRMRFRDIKISSRFANGNDYIYNNRVYNYAFDFSTSGGGGDTNNDIAEFWNVQVTGANWCFNSGGFNPHQFYFYRCSWVDSNWGMSSPSFHWVNGISSNLTYCVFYISGNHQPIVIDTHNDEHSGRLLESISISASAPITIRGLRWNSERTMQDIVINVLGQNSVELDSCFFGDAKNRVCRLGQDIVYNVPQNTAGLRVVNCYNVRTETNLSGTESLLLDNFCIGEFLINSTQIDFANNEVNLGYPHYMPDGQVLFCNNGGANSFGFPQSSAPYFVVTHATDPNRFSLLTNYENETAFTFVNNGGSKVMKFRLGGSYLNGAAANGRPIYAVKHTSSERPYLPVLPKEVSILIGTKRYNTSFAPTNSTTSVTQGNAYQLLNIYSTGRKFNMIVTLEDGITIETYWIALSPSELSLNQWYKCTPISSAGGASYQTANPTLLVRLSMSTVWQDYGVNIDNYLARYEFAAVANRVSTPLLSITAQPLGGMTSFVNALFYGEEVSEVMTASGLSILQLPTQNHMPWFKGAPNQSGSDATKFNVPVEINGQTIYFFGSTNPAAFPT